MTTCFRLTALVLVIATTQTGFSQTPTNTGTATQPINTDPKDCCE